MIGVNIEPFCKYEFINNDKIHGGIKMTKNKKINNNDQKSTPNNNNDVYGLFNQELEVDTDVNEDANRERLLEKRTKKIMVRFILVRPLIEHHCIGIGALKPTMGTKKKMCQFLSYC
jgi:hypothetical protein